MQGHFDLIPHSVQGGIVYQRPGDGYINATAMCQATNRLFGDYRRLKSTGEFLEALAADMGNPITELVQSVNGGTPELQGTWVHPDVAIHLGQWCSPTFAVKVTRWVREWMSGHRQPRQSIVPYHLRRYAANRLNVPQGHFSILVEMTTLLIGPLEIMGYTLPDRMLPDVSQGRMFCRWLREKHGIDTDALPTYPHDYEDGRRVTPKAYPDQLLADFRHHFHTDWLPLQSVPYFRSRDSRALQYLPKLIAGPANSSVRSPRGRTA